MAERSTQKINMVYAMKEVIIGKYAK